MKTLKKKLTRDTIEIEKEDWIEYIKRSTADVDSEVSFADDADEEIDTTVIEEEEDWIEYIKKALKMQWKRWNVLRFDAGTEHKK